MATINVGTVANVLVGLAGIRVSTVNEYPLSTTQIGYTENGAQVQVSPSITNINVAEENTPIASTLDTEEVKVAFDIAEATLANMEIALVGGSNTLPSTIRLGGYGIKYKSLLLDGDAPGGTSGIRQFLFQKVASTGQVTHAFRKNEKQMFTCEFSAYTPTLGKAFEAWDVWDYTIATATFAYVAGKKGIRINGEGGAADTLDTISAPPASGTQVILRPWEDVANTKNITITHTGTPAAGTIFLTGAANLVFTDPRDYIVLQSDGTDWTEVSHQLF